MYINDVGQSTWEEIGMRWKKLDHALPMAIMINQHARARLLQSAATRNRVGRRFWQSDPSPENARTFYVRVVQQLRRLQRRGVVERLQEITAHDKTPIAVEI